MNRARTWASCLYALIGPREWRFLEIAKLTHPRHTREELRAEWDGTTYEGQERFCTKYRKAGRQ